MITHGYLISKHNVIGRSYMSALEYRSRSLCAHRVIILAQPAYQSTAPDIFVFKPLASKYSYKRERGSRFDGLVSVVLVIRQVISKRGLQLVAIVPPCMCFSCERKDGCPAHCAYGLRGNSGAVVAEGRLISRCRYSLVQGIVVVFVVIVQAWSRRADHSGSCRDAY